MIETAYQKNDISLHKKNSLYQEIEDLSIQLGMYLNHRASSVLTADDYVRVIDTINYMFLHGFDLKHANLSNLKDCSIQSYYDYGLSVIEEDINNIKELWKNLLDTELPFQNDRYISILHDQIPNYLKSIDTYEAIIHYSYVEDDLDYPLVDGLPLFHDMYHLQGSDLIKYYLKRFHIEQTFCNIFHNDLNEFIFLYEEQKGVSIQFLGLNLFEQLIYQVVAHFMLYQKAGIILQMTDITRLNHLLQSSSLHCLIDEAFFTLTNSLDTDTSSYILTFKNQIFSSFQRFINEEFELFIYQKPVDKRNTLIINTTDLNDKFNEILNHTLNLSDVSSKISYLNSEKLSVCDIFDLLENGIFMEDEYFAYFSIFTANELAIMVKAMNGELCSFHQYRYLNQDLFNELPNDTEWQKYFIKYLTSYVDKEAVECQLNDLNVEFI